MGLFNFLFGRRVDVEEVLCDIELKQKMAETLNNVPPERRLQLLEGMSEEDKRDVLANLNEQLGIRPLKPPKPPLDLTDSDDLLLPYVEGLPAEDQPHAERMLEVAKSTNPERTVPAEHYVTLLAAMMAGSNCDSDTVNNFLLDTIECVQRTEPAVTPPPAEGTVTHGR